MSYANGMAPASALSFVNGVPLAPSFAARFIAFQAFAASQGRTIRIFDGRLVGWKNACGGYCDYPSQQERHDRGGGGGSSVSIALPGASTHGIYDTGRGDIVGETGHSYTPAELSWIVANASRFGLARSDFGAADPNHFTASGAFAGGNIVPLNNGAASQQPPKESSMTTVYKVTSTSLSGVHFALSEDYCYVYPADQVAAAVNVAAPNFNRASGGTVIDIGQTMNADILLHDLGFTDGQLEQVAVSGGGGFYRPTPASAATFTDAQIAQLAAAIKPFDPTPIIAAINAAEAAESTAPAIDYNALAAAIVAKLPPFPTKIEGVLS